MPETPSVPLKATALWYVDRGRAALLEETLGPLTESDALIATRYSAVSRGTERLVYLGAVPETEWSRMRAPFQSGDFPFPVKYGYCAVGVVEKGPQALEGHVAFCLHPHQDKFIAPASMLMPVPAGIPAKRATLAANMETALNAHWDGATQPGDRVIVIGGGIVGLLTAYLAGRIPGTNVTLVDVATTREPLAKALGVAFARPDSAPAGEADVVFHASATERGLQSAIDSAGLEGRVVEMSWFGAKEVSISLGGAFHSKRLKMISSQVGHVPEHRRARWSFRRRLAKAMELLADPVLDALVETEIPFKNAPAMLPAVFADQSTVLAPVLSYDAAR